MDEYAALKKSNSIFYVFRKIITVIMINYYFEDHSKKQI